MVTGSEIAHGASALTIKGSITSKKFFDLVECFYPTVEGIAFFRLPRQCVGGLDCNDTLS